MSFEESRRIQRELLLELQDEKANTHGQNDEIIAQIQIQIKNQSKYNIGAIAMKQIKKRKIQSQCVHPNCGTCKCPISKKKKRSIPKERRVPNTRRAPSTRRAPNTRHVANLKPKNSGSECIPGTFARNFENVNENGPEQSKDRNHANKSKKVMNLSSIDGNNSDISVNGTVASEQMSVH